jgi:DNA-binding Lrp family transcriptional regulator
MAFDAVDAALGLQGISPSMKLALAVVAKFQNKQTRKCNPSEKQIARVSGLSVRTVKRMLKAARERDLITGESGKTNHETSDYVLNFVADVTVTPGQKASDAMTPEPVSPCHQPGTELVSRCPELVSQWPTNKEEQGRESQGVSEESAIELSTPKLSLDEIQDPAQRLATKFWFWQRRPAKFRKGSGWVKRFRVLLTKYPDLEAMLTHFFEKDGFWPDHLVRRTGDPLDYLEKKLLDLDQRYCAVQAAVEKSRRNPAASAAPATPADSPKAAAFPVLDPNAPLWKTWTEDVAGIPAAEIRKAILYHSKHNPHDTYHKERMSVDYVRRFARKLVESVRAGWQPPPPRTYWRKDPDCPKCHGKGLPPKHLESGAAVVNHCECEKEVEDED